MKRPGRGMTKNGKIHQAFRGEGEESNERGGRLSPERVALTEFVLPPKG